VSGWFHELFSFVSLIVLTQDDLLWEANARVSKDLMRSIRLSVKKKASHTDSAHFGEWSSRDA
jgi:hypothetical protein